MREILFRAKRSFNKKWVTGSLVMDGNMAYIIGEAESAKNINALVNGHTVNVIPATIGQFTGLTDKNGTKIFEGDIVRNLTDSNKAVVQWFEEYSAFMLYGKIGNRVYFLYDNNFNHIEVVGNIHDNPELLDIVKLTGKKNGMDGEE